LRVVFNAFHPRQRRLSIAPFEGQSPLCSLPSHNSCSNIICTLRGLVVPQLSKERLFGFPLRVPDGSCCIDGVSLYSPPPPLHDRSCLAHGLASGFFGFLPSMSGPQVFGQLYGHDIFLLFLHVARSAHPPPPPLMVFFHLCLDTFFFFFTIPVFLLILRKGFHFATFRPPLCRIIRGLEFLCFVACVGSLGLSLFARLSTPLLNPTLRRHPLCGPACKHIWEPSIFLFPPPLLAKILDFSDGLSPPPFPPKSSCGGVWSRYGSLFFSRPDHSMTRLFSFLGLSPLLPPISQTGFVFFTCFASP